jgi:hypothetical protein
LPEGAGFFKRTVPKVTYKHSELSLTLIRNTDKRICSKTRDSVGATTDFSYEASTDPIVVFSTKVTFRNGKNNENERKSVKVTDIGEILNEVALWKCNL